MRFSCLQENLSRGLSIVGRAVATRSTLPITQNVLLSAEEGMLTLSATNLEIAISTKIGGQIEEPGAVTVPARLLTEFVNSLPPAETIDMAYTAQPVGLSLKCARFKANINGNPHDEFPPIPTVADGSAIRIAGQTLSNAIAHVGFAAATEDSRPVLTGMKVEIKDDDFTFAAADGFRLAVFHGKLAEPVDEEVEFIIPAKTMIEIRRLIGGLNTTVEFTVTASDKQALFRMDKVEVVSQLVDGAFPNYQQLIPADYKNRLVVEQKEFLRATRTASIFAKDGSGIVRLEALKEGEDNTGHLTVSSRADELGDNEGQIDAVVEIEEGNESRIAFNSKYLSDVLDILGDGKIAMEISSSSSPGVFRPLNMEGYTHVIMPMFVQW